MLKWSIKSSKIPCSWQSSESSFVGVGIKDAFVDGGKRFLEIHGVDDFGKFLNQVLHVFCCPINVFLWLVLEKVAVRATLLSSSQHPKNLLLEISKSYLRLPVGCPWPQRLSWGHHEDYPTKSSRLALSATTQIPINWLRRASKGRGGFLGLIGA